MLLNEWSERQASPMAGPGLGEGRHPLRTIAVAIPSDRPTRR